MAFQSTLPIQGETPKQIRIVEFRHISIHSPYTGRDTPAEQLKGALNISIHSPYTGRDLIISKQLFCINDFNPLSLYRERLFGSTHSTGLYVTFQSTLPIQGETHSCVRYSLSSLYFNPLSLYRERRPVRYKFDVN